MGTITRLSAPNRTNSQPMQCFFSTNTSTKKKKTWTFEADGLGGPCMNVSHVKAHTKWQAIITHNETYNIQQLLNCIWRLGETFTTHLNITYLNRIQFFRLFTQCETLAQTTNNTLTLLTLNVWFCAFVSFSIVDCCRWCKFNSVVYIHCFCFCCYY